MKEITDKELLQLQLDILRDVDSFCRKNYANQGRA